MVKQRSIGVTIFAMTMFLFSLCSLPVAFAFIIVACTSSANLIVYGIGALALLLPLLGILAAIGLFQLKNWGRILTLVMASLIGILGIFTIGFLVLCQIMTSGVQGRSTLQVIILILFYLAMTLLGVGLLYFFTRPKVKEQFI